MPRDVPPPHPDPTLESADLAQQGMTKLGTDMIEEGDIGPPDQGKPGPFEKATYGVLLLTLFAPFIFIFGGE